jgi:hypothetical protein
LAENQAMLNRRVEEEEVVIDGKQSGDIPHPIFLV